MPTNTELFRAALLGAVASIELASDRAMNLNMIDAAYVHRLDAIADSLQLFLDEVVITEP